jgi:hypothetical protein
VIPAVYTAQAECVDSVPRARQSVSALHTHVTRSGIDGSRGSLSRSVPNLRRSAHRRLRSRVQHSLYRRTAGLKARQSGDLDILVRACDLPQIGNVLAKRGYRARRYEEGSSDIGFFGVSEDQFVNERDVIDLHLDLLPSYFPSPRVCEAMWSDAVKINLEHGDVKTLAPSDQLLFSILHATKHGWGCGSLRSSRSRRRSSHIERAVGPEKGFEQFQRQAATLQG